MTMGARQVIGFDLGHGESALARVSVDSDDSPEMLEIFPGMKTIVTAVGHHPAKGTVIGDRALTSAEITDGKIAFKRRPSTDKLARRLMRDFAGAVVQTLLDRGKISDPKDTRFFVGCPSGWEEPEITAYENLLVEAGLPLVSVTPESRAAMMHARESGLLTMNELKSFVLVVDVGSSTTDLTAVQGKAKDPVRDDGEDLGASLIDSAILEYSIRQGATPDLIRNAFRVSPNLLARCLLLCRRAKEEYYRDQERYDEEQSFVRIGYEDLQGQAIFEPKVSTATMRQLLDQPIAQIDGKARTWPDALRHLLHDARTRLETRKRTVSIILLTGGASRMDFVPTACQTVFPGATVKLGAEPEYAIARGLARYGRMSIKTEGFLKEIEEFCEDAVPAAIAPAVPDLIERLVAPLSNGIVTNVVRPSLIDWREGRVKTLNDLEKHMERVAQRWVKSADARERIGGVAQEWFIPIEQELNDQTREIAKRYGIPSGSLRIDLKYRPDLETFKGLPIDTTADLDVLASVVGLIVATVVANLFLGAGHAILVTGPIGVVIGIIVALAAWAIGQEALVGSVKGWDLPRPARGLVLRRTTIDNAVQKPEDRQKLEESMRTMLQEDETILPAIVQGVSDQIREALHQRAYDASILIR